jgi:signal transduction histidine kinase
MPLSRLRLRLSAAFALAFALGLAALNPALFLVLRREADRQLTHRLAAAATQVAEALAREYGEAPHLGLAAAARETFRELPATANSFVIYDGSGARLAVHGQPAGIAMAPAEWRTGDPAVLDRSEGNQDVRIAADRRVNGEFRVVAIGTRQPTEEHLETLGWWLLASAPLVVLLSLVGGYALARQALRPISTLERAVAALDPADLARRLPVADRPDELDRLALRFNELLGRLEQAQLRNRQFVQRAAHQLKTPLTVVLGEADLSLSDGAGAGAPGMRRVRTAAHQMRRRVDELLLLAEAQAGEQVPLDDEVELDGLALECADLMRGRAAQLSRSLTLGRVEPITVRGSERLLREALVELIENACRHGSAEPAIQVSVYGEGPVAWVEVASGGAPTRSAEADPPPNDEGMHLGLTIVRWIAGQHGGRFRYEHMEGVNVFGFSVLPDPAGVTHVTAGAGVRR